MKPVLFLLARLREPSTLAGLAVLSGLLSIQPSHIQAVAEAVGYVAAAAAVFVPEGRN